MRNVFVRLQIAVPNDTTFDSHCDVLHFVMGKLAETVDNADEWAEKFKPHIEMGVQPVGE